MKIRTRPLLIAAGVGLAVQIVLSLVSNVISALAMRPAWTGQLGPGQLPPTGQLLGSGLIGTLACLCVLIVDVGVGLLYANLHSREAPVTAGDGALGGAAAGAIVGLIGGLFGVLVALVVTPIMMRGMLSGMPQEMLPSAIGGGLVGGAVGSLIGVCLGIFRGALLSALGGALGGAIFKPKPEPAA